MRFAVDIPNFGEYFHPRTMAEIGKEAEDAGWDGLFIWDHLWLGETDPFVDPWVALTAIALNTERIRLGTMVTPLARRSAWKLARETVSVDQVSDGRLILGVGLGAPPDLEFASFGMETDNITRARMLDEGLDVLTSLWSGDPTSYRGQHYQIDNVTFQPPTLQQPRIPIWVAGVWPRKPPFRRAARWDGMFPIKNDGTEPTDMTSEMPVLMPQDIEDAVIFTKSYRVSEGPFDVVTGIQDSMMSRSELGRIAAEYEDAGLTWQTHSFGPWNGTIEECRARIRQGPPTM
ncbi:MAG: LLM class flavin-dependent oxidoreductase [SAR202 cluster bacterium]|nr:LLM class flavin-dependent oxidoreductase [SAR202 cluster bacterium]